MRKQIHEVIGTQYKVLIFQEEDGRITYDLYTEDDEYWFPFRESAGFHSTFWLADLKKVIDNTVEYISTLNLDKWHMVKKDGEEERKEG